MPRAPGAPGRRSVTPWCPLDLRPCPYPLSLDGCRHQDVSARTWQGDCRDPALLLKIALHLQQLLLRFPPVLELALQQGLVGIPPLLEVDLVWNLQQLLPGPPLSLKGERHRGTQPLPDDRPLRTHHRAGEHTGGDPPPVFAARGINDGPDCLIDDPGIGDG